MKKIEIYVHLPGVEHPKAITIAEDATIEELVKELKAAGAAFGESEHEIVLWIDNKEVRCHKKRKLDECGIHHGHHLHCHGHAVEIKVNTRDEKWEKPEISYSEVVPLAFPNQSSDPKNSYSVTYSKGPHENREGTLVAGQSVKVKCGMIFNVKHTFRS